MENLSLRNRRLGHGQIISLFKESAGWFVYLSVYEWGRLCFACTGPECIVAPLREKIETPEKRHLCKLMILNRRFSMKKSLAAILFIFVLFPSAPAIFAQSNAYHCVLYTKNAGKDVRFSSIPVQTQTDMATLNAAWKQYVIITYHVSDPNAYGGCQSVAGTLAQQEMVVTSAEANYKRLGAEVVHVSWTSAPGQTLAAPTPSPAKTTSAPVSPAQPAAAPAANPAPSPAPVARPVPSPAPAAPASMSTAPSTGGSSTGGSFTGGSFIACATSGGAGIDTYLTAVFQTAKPVPQRPNGGYLVDQAILDRFYAYLTQKGYNFKPGSNYACAVARTEAEAETAKHKRYYEGGGCSTCGKTVETGWKDTQ
jgi:hypothetical protein